MYLQYWGLTSKPFENRCDSRFYYPGQKHQATLLKLRYILEDRRGSAILAGPSGVGKTQLIHQLREQKSMESALSPLIRIVCPQLEPEELLYLISLELGDAEDGEKRAKTPAACLASIERSLLRNREQNRSAVLLIDEAHTIEDPRTFSLFKSLLNIEHNGEACLSLVLSGETALLARMSRFESLGSCIDIKCFLAPLEETETAEYIAHRLHAGGADREIFEPGGVALIHELSEGIPRRINRLCDLALLIGLAEGLKTIGIEEIAELNQDLIST